MLDFTVYKDLGEFTALFEFDKKLDRLKELAIPEQWDYRNPGCDGEQQPNKILRNYIRHTFGRLLDEHSTAGTPDEQQSIIYIKEDDDPKKSLACFNTGLFTPKFNPIYALMYKNTRDNIFSSIFWKSRKISYRMFLSYRGARIILPIHQN